MYKFAAKDAQHKYNAKHLPKSEAIHVTYFDQLEGLSEDTLKIVNDKIEEIKDHSESRCLFYIQQVNELQEEISTFKKLKEKKGGFGILGMKLEEIISNLPLMVKDMTKMFDLIVEAFGENSILALAMKKFGGKIPSSGDGDNGGLNSKYIQEVQNIYA